MNPTDAALDRQKSLTMQIADWAMTEQAAAISAVLGQGWPLESVAFVVPLAIMTASYYHPEWLAAAMHIVIEGKAGEVDALRIQADRVIQSIPIMEQEPA